MRDCWDYYDPYCCDEWVVVEEYYSPPPPMREVVYYPVYERPKTALVTATTQPGWIARNEQLIFNGAVAILAGTVILWIVYRFLKITGRP